MKTLIAIALALASVPAFADEYCETHDGQKSCRHISGLFINDCDGVGFTAKRGGDWRADMRQLQAEWPALPNADEACTRHLLRTGALVRPTPPVETHCVRNPWGDLDCVTY